MLSFYVFGYGVAFGEGPNSNGFIGVSEFALSGTPQTNISFYFFQSCFACTCATIVSGCIIERTKPFAYFWFSAVMTAFLYPVVVHWVWSSSGWLGQKGNIFEGLAFIDLAGSSVVHMVGGFSGLIGAIIIGPRLGFLKSNRRASAVRSVPAHQKVTTKVAVDANNVVGLPVPRVTTRTSASEAETTKTNAPRWRQSNDHEIRGHSIVLNALGTLVLWFAWYGFNGGSTLALTNGSYLLVGRVCTNTSLAASAAGLTTILLYKFVHASQDITMILNSILGGLVAITASCHAVDHWAAIIIGFFAALVCVYTSRWINRLGIDDPLTAVSVHGFCGAWGVFATGVFSMPEFGAGVIYGEGKQLAIQVIGMIAILAWSVVIAALCFAVINRTVGLRVSFEDELQGLDASIHADAYPEFHRIEKVISNTMAFEEMVRDLDPKNDVVRAFHKVCDVCVMCVMCV